MLWNTAYFYPKIKWPSKIQVCQTQQRQTAAAGGDHGLRCAGGPQSIRKLERRYGNSPNNLVSVVVICRTSVKRVQSRSVSNAHGSSLRELPQHRFSRFCSTGTTELSLFAFGWKHHARHCGQSWQMLLWARCWTRWLSPADEVQWFDVTKFHLSPQSGSQDLRGLCGHFEESWISVSQNIWYYWGCGWSSTWQRVGSGGQDEQAHLSVGVVNTMWSCTSTATEMHLQRYKPLQTGSGVPWHF